MLRRSLRTSVWEGAFAELVNACAAGGVITAWALYLELSPALIGVLGALPFSAQFVHLPASWLTRRLGSRRAALWTLTLGRQAILPLAALPWLPVAPGTRHAIFLACTFVSSALGIAGNNAWTAWMGDLVPAEVRGRYFGRRNAVCALAATCAALGAGILLDSGRDYGHAGAALSALTLVACGAGAVTTLLLRRQQAAPAAPRFAVSLTDALEPVRDARGQRLLTYQVAWSVATGIAAAFYPLHMIGNLRMGFARMALYTAAIAAFKMLAAPIWGQVLDRRGARFVLIASSFALCFSPVLWLFASEGHLTALAIDAALNGVAMAGFTLATFSLPIALSRPASRSFYVAAFAAAGGLAAAIGSAAGGVLVKYLPEAWSLFGLALVSSHALFLVGAGARICASLLALRVSERPEAAVVQLLLPPAEERAKLSA